MHLKIVLIFLVVYIVHSTVSLSPLVKLPQGFVKGKFEQSRNGTQYEAYLGIRYGKVPQRFGVAQPYTTPWNGAIDATSFGPHCAQPSVADGTVVIGEEDCLYLNVYTKAATTDANKPVFFYIHGGGFTYGTGAPFGAKYLMDADVVLVTVNYRLGILGFLNMNNEHASGNMGLKDQLLALKWVNENIHHFGGDKTKVTVSGESAGGASTIYMMLSPSAKGLFHNAIPFSGVPLNPWAFTENSKANALTVGEKLNCPDDTTFVECLRSKSVQELLTAQESLSRWFMDPMDPFPPTLEIKSEFNPEPFLEISPAEAIASQAFTPVPVLMAMNKDEGVVLYTGVVLKTEEKRKELDKSFDKVAPITFCYKNDPILAASPQRLEDASAKIRQFYFGDREINFAVKDDLANLYTDALFGYGIHRAALGLARKSEVYAGLFTHVSKTFSTASVFGITEILGIGHGDEASYIFNPALENAPLPIIAQITTPEDISFSEDIVKALAHFMEFSAPDVEKFPEWKPISAEEIEHNAVNWIPLEDGFESKVLLNPFKARISFWDKLYNNRKETSKEEL